MRHAASPPNYSQAHTQRPNSLAPISKRMIDIHSVEFYVIAFVVAMALVTLLVGQRSRGEATTNIDTFDLIPSMADEAGLLAISSEDTDRVAITRTGLPIFEGDTVVLVSTVIDDKWHIEEKRATKGRGAHVAMDGAVEVSFLRPGRYHVRYDSEVTGQWCTFTHTHRPGNTTRAQLKY